MSTYLFPARERAQITVNDVSITRGVNRVLTGVDLRVTPTSRIAVVGENGRGKTTLLHVLSGRLTPDSGVVTRIGTLVIAEQEMPADDGRTVGDAVSEAIAPSVQALAELDAAIAQLADAPDGDATAENRYARTLEDAEALDAWDAQRRVEVALAALSAETDMSRPLAHLSVGQRYRVRLACLLGGDADFLLLDEPTNHLDEAGLVFLAASIKSRRGGVVLVSHDRSLISEVAETIVDLDPTPDGRPRAYGDGYEGYQTGRAGELERWSQDFQKQQLELARLKDDLSAAQNRLVSKWRPEKGSPKHGRATRAGALVQAVHRRQDALEAHKVTVPPPPHPFRFPDLTSNPGTVLVHADEASFAGRLPGPVSLTVSGEDRLVVVGPNGAGKSTLLDLLAGDLEPTSGLVRRSHRARIGYLKQESSLPVRKYANEFFTHHVEQLVAAGFLRDSETVGLSHLGLLAAADQHKRIGELSTGQQRRLDLAVMLVSKPNLVLLDEPTNHFSMSLVDELTEALQTTKAAVIVSTHDRKLLTDLKDWPDLMLKPR